MINNINENLLFKLTDSSKSSALYAIIAEAVTQHFKSMHYLSSSIICDCVLANLVLNDEITPDSANYIISCFKRKHRSLYGNVANAYKAIADDFYDYAKSVLRENFERVKLQTSKFPIANYIVYVISTDIKLTKQFDRREPIICAFGYNYYLDKPI